MFDQFAVFRDKGSVGDAGADNMDRGTHCKVSEGVTGLLVGISHGVLVLSGVCVFVVVLVVACRAVSAPPSACAPSS